MLWNYETKKRERKKEETEGEKKGEKTPKKSLRGATEGSKNGGHVTVGITTLRATSHKASVVLVVPHCGGGLRLRIKIGQSTPRPMSVTLCVNRTASPSRPIRMHA